MGGETGSGAAVDELRGVAVGLTPASWGFSKADSIEFRGRLHALDGATKIRLLHAAVELMPAYREAADASTGVLLYAAATVLYREKLPLTESDLVDLLRAARHGCGHGCDTRAPFDLAVAYMRRNGYSTPLAGAIQEFTSNLPPAIAVTVKELRRSADLLSVLTAPAQPGPRTRLRPWIDGVAEHLVGLEPTELDHWRRLVLAMSVSERHLMPKTWSRVALPFLDEVGPDLAVSRLRQWWPEPGGEISLKKSGAQLLKHFIWLLGLVPGHDGEDLVCALATMTWYPSRAPMAVLKPASTYLADAASPSAAQARSVIDTQIAAAD